MLTCKKVLQLWKYPKCTTLRQDCQWLREKSCYPDRNLRLQRRHCWTPPQGWDLCSPVLTKSVTSNEIRSNQNVSSITCFGIHGHLQVCRILQIYIFILLRCLFFTWSQSMQARKCQKTRRKTAQEKNTNGKHAECDHVKQR
jgi:hypothetical protein